MCGIIGAITGEHVTPLLLSALHRLEYRGYDSAGVATLVNGYQESGVRQAIWSGKDGNGNGMPSGIYFYRLEVNGLVLTKKMQLLK